MTVHDARGRRLRGHVVHADAPPSRFSAVTAPLRFEIWLMTAARDVPSCPDGVAVCVPSGTALHAVGGDAPLPRSLAALTLPRDRMAAYAAGRIIGAVGLLEPSDVFPAHSDRPRLDRLALALIETAEAEAIAPFTAVIRHELGLPAGDDALGELERRLSPEHAADRLPPRAPAIVRLRRALKALRAGGAPDFALEQLTDDLRFLRLFEPAGAEMTRAGLTRLLRDVRDDAPGEPGGARILPLRRPGSDA